MNKKINFGEYEEVVNYLKSISEEKYREFSKKITPGDFTILGIRIPTLKNIARAIYKGDYKSFLHLEDNNIFEIRMLKALVVSNIKDKEEYRREFEKILPLIDNWAICDTFINSSKIIIKDKEYFFEKAKKLIASKNEYDNRVAFVILLTYYASDNYKDEIFNLILNFKSDSYYANMALSWLLSILYIKYKTDTQAFLLKAHYDKIIYKMTIRKIKDSYRVSTQDKKWLDEVLALKICNCTQ